MKKAELIALLIRIGVEPSNAEKIAAGTADDYATTFLPADQELFVTDYKAKQAALFKNDASVVEEIRNAEKAKNLEQFERKMKQTFGLTAEEVKDKKWDEIVALAKTKSGEGNDKTSQELQTKIIELTAENKRLNDDEIPKIKGEATQYKKKFDIEQKFLSLIPKGDDKIRFPFETVKTLLQGDLNSAYDVDLDDKNEFVIKQKGVDLLAKNADGTKFLTMTDFVNSRLEHHGALVKSNAGAGGAGAGKADVIIETDKNKVLTPAMKKAQAHEATLLKENDK